MRSNSVVCSTPRRRREDFVYAPGEEVPRDVTRVVVPGSVTVLPANAFRDNRSLEEVVLEEGVVEVGQSAFGSCTVLRELNLPEGITEIGSGAFHCLSSLECVRLPSTLNTISEDAFYSCALLREVIFPDGIRHIRDGAFFGCKSLESIVLPSSLNVIDRHAFGDCLSLRTVELLGGIQIILHEAFDECDSLDHIRVPCKALVITGNREGENFVLVRDRFAPPPLGHRKLAIASECFNSIHPEEMSNIETDIIGVLGREIMQSGAPWLEDSLYNEWDEKCQQLRALLAPHEKRHKKEIASLLEQRGVEMVLENVLSFLHFLC